MKPRRVKSAQKKYTVEIEEDLVQSALEATGQNFTETIRQGLRLIAAREAYEGLRKMRGTVDLELDIDELRGKKKRGLR